MKIVAYGYQLRDRDYDTIKKMAGFLTNDVVDVMDLRSYEVVGDKEAVMLVYGEHAKQECSKVHHLQLVEFPDASRLDPALGDDNEERQDAFTTLRRLKEVLDSGGLTALDSTESNARTHLTEESLPNLTADKVRELERHLREKDVDHWQGITQDGKTIRISLEPDESAADIKMTFAELFAVIGLKETFRVKELEIVYKPSSTSR